VLKRSKKSNKSKSIEVKVEVPVTKSGFMGLVLVILISLVGYSGYLGINSIWKFTHPQFNISLDSFKSLSYVAKGLNIPPITGPNIAQGFNISEEKTTQYLQGVTQFKNEFRQKHPSSKLLTITDNDLLNLGWALCKSKETELSKSGSFNQSDIILAMKARFVLKYWQIDGLSEYLDGVANSAFQNLCGDN
jgi:hypothetical protein